MPKWIGQKDIFKESRLGTWKTRAQAVKEGIKVSMKINSKLYKETLRCPPKGGKIEVQDICSKNGQ